MNAGGDVDAVTLDAAVWAGMRVADAGVTSDDAAAEEDVISGVSVGADVVAAAAPPEEEEAASGKVDVVGGTETDTPALAQICHTYCSAATICINLDPVGSGGGGTNLLDHQGCKQP